MVDCNTCGTSATPEWDLFDQSEDCEAKLFSSVVSEFTNIAGFPIKYYKSLANMDQIFGEDPINNYTDPVEFKLIYEPTDETGVIQSFGFSSMDMVQYAQVPKQIFSGALSDIFETYHISGDCIQPHVGDVITTLWNQRNYEIVDIGSEDAIFMGQKHIWQLILKPFRFSEQSEKSKDIYLNTNIDSIEIIEEEMENDSHISDEYGDNEIIEDESDEIDDYKDVDESFFGM